MANGYQNKNKNKNKTNGKGEEKERENEERGRSREGSFVCFILVPFITPVILQIHWTWTLSLEIWFIFFDKVYLLSFLNLNEEEASKNLWMAWLIFKWGSTRDMQQWIFNDVDLIAIPSKNEHENLRAHNFVNLAPICAILGSTDIYSE